MDKEMPSEVWEDVGIHDRPSKEETKVLATHLKNFSKYEVLESSRIRKEKNLQAIQDLGLSFDEKDSMIVLKVKNFTFDIWPASDTWYSHSKQRYGIGIESLLDLIKKRLIDSATMSQSLQKVQSS